jgi:hypothetical protein
MLGEALLEFKSGQLQQLNRLLQLRSHNQLLTKPKVEPKLHSHTPL